MKIPWAFLCRNAFSTAPRANQFDSISSQFESRTLHSEFIKHFPTLFGNMNNWLLIIYHRKWKNTSAAQIFKQQTYLHGYFFQLEVYNFVLPIDKQTGTMITLCVHGMGWMSGWMSFLCRACSADGSVDDRLVLRILRGWPTYAAHVLRMVGGWPDCAAHVLRGWPTCAAHVLRMSRWMTRCSFESVKKHHFIFIHWRRFVSNRTLF